MTNALSIAIPALALFAILAIPKQPRWTRQPWFTKAHPHRGYLAALAALLLLAAIIHATT